MLGITIHLASALLCANGWCYPVLVGRDGHQTPTGTYTAHVEKTADPLYHGSVIVFKQGDKQVWSIHRVWKGHPNEKRGHRLKHGVADDRHISYGCVNVSKSVYKYLHRYCRSGCKVTIDEE